jgi:hypothetical protein
VVSGRDSGGLGGGIVVSGRDSGGLRGGIVASGRDSNGAGRGIEGFGRVVAIARLLGGTLGSNCCKAFRLVLCFSYEIRQGAQVALSLLPRPAEASLKKEESGRFWKQEEQYLASITDVFTGVFTDVFTDGKSDANASGRNASVRARNASVGASIDQVM